MKKNIFFTFIILLALLLRIAFIGYFPATLYGDEQAFTWNAYNILKLGHDEYGNPFPLQFKSFDDYKAPIPVYFLVPFIKIFGMTPFSIRLPIVLASVATVIATYCLVSILLDKKIGLLTAFLLAVSPWHIHLSRGYFESTLSLTFFVFGILAFLRAKTRLSLLLLSSVLFAGSAYSYFTPRMYLLVFLPVLYLWGKFAIGLSRKKTAVHIAFLTILILPLIYLSLFKSGGSRFNKLLNTNLSQTENTVNFERSTSLLPSPWPAIFHNKATVTARQIKNNYFEILSSNFWYINGGSSLRYFLGNMGMFYLIEMLFFVAGLYLLWKNNRLVAALFTFWLLIMPIPAAIVGKPFAVRSMSLLPAPFIFVAVAVTQIGRLNRSKLFSFISAVFYCISLAFYLLRYYHEYPVYAATWWGWENKAALDYAQKQESDYDYIFISNFYSGATLAYTVYNQLDPLEYRYSVNNPVILADGRHFIKLGKYYFGSLDIDKEKLAANIIPPRSLYIARPEEADSDETINAPDDGRIIFKVYRVK